jgi:HJR/Mrr/RecB family endonuclease
MENQKPIEFFEIGKEFKTNQGIVVKVTHISNAFGGFPICAKDVKDETPYRFNLFGIDYFDFSHEIAD